MPSIRKMKLRQVYHHRVITRMVAHQFDPTTNYLSALKDVTFTEYPGVGDFAAVIKKKIDPVGTKHRVLRIKDIQLFDKHGWITEDLRYNFESDRAAVCIQELVLRRVFISALIEANLPKGKYIVTDAYAYGCLEAEGHGIKNVDAVQDLRIHRRKFFHNGVKYKVDGDYVTFWFNH